MHESADTVLMFLNGTAMSGFADHIHVEGSRFLGVRRTAAAYRFYAVRSEYPGLVAVSSGGASIVGELYEMDRSRWAHRLLPHEPPELVPGKVELDDGTQANAMLLELVRVPPGDTLVDIAEFGGWRPYVDYLATKNAR